MTTSTPRPPARDEAVSTTRCRAIVRCSVKGCRRAHRVEFTSGTRTWAHDGRMAQARFILRDGEDTRRPYRDRHDIADSVIGRVPGFVCTGCGGRYYTFDVVVGSFSEAVKCGARCQGAVGPSCECSCGGENHSIGHAAL